MKKINHFLTVSSICCGLAMTIAFSACEDYLTIYPTDKTTGKDYWKKKEHVDEMVGGAYKQMTASGTEERAIMWGIFRSDDVIKSESYNNTDMEYIRAVSLYPSQSICKWDVYYNVINRCNQVLKHAPEVQTLDPEFTEGDYEVVRGQMLALRSLAYFYLVRAFRDVPYTGDEAFEGDEQVAAIPQSTPSVVLQHCIDDLNIAAGLVMKSGAYGDWRDKGYFTQDACWALLADIYLWRACMTGNRADYEHVVENVERVIDSKDRYYKRVYSDRLNALDQTDRYHLYQWEGGREGTPLYNIFVNGNSRESILELQYNNNNANGTLCSFLFRDGNDRSYSRLMASQIYNSIAKDGANTESASKAFFTENDYRYWAYLYDVNDENATELHIRKYATASGALPRDMSSGSNGDQWKDGGYVSANNFERNWVVYRLTDLMLMEAEALVQLAAGSGEEDPQIRQAFNLVQVVNKRSMKENSTDTLSIDKYPTKEQMELLVLSERQRELCFECKRWFDLIRFAYRHMEGVNADALMAASSQWPELYKSMVSLAARGYTIGSDVFNLKMRSEPFLYWPIHEDEIKVNSLLKQNPAFVQTGTSNRQ